MDPETLEKINELLNKADTVLGSVTEKIQGAASGVEGIGQTGDKTAQSLDKVSVSADKATDATEKLEAAQRGLVGSLTSTIMGSQKGNEHWEKFIDRAKKVGFSSENISKNLELVAKAASAGTLAVAGINDVLGTTFESMGIGSKTAQDTAGSVDAVASSMVKWGQGLPFFNKLGEKATNAIAGMIKQTQGVRELESSMMSLMGQFGGFRDAQNRVGFTRSLERQMTEMIRLNRDVANTTNTSTEEVSKYATALLKIPGAYKQTIDLGTTATKNITLLEGAMRVTRGTTGDFTDATDALTLQFRQFRDVDEKALGLMAQTYKISQSLGVGFKDLNGIVKGVVEQFAMFGSTMESSVRLVGSLSRALMDTGIGIEPTKRIVDSMTSSLKDMGVAQRAFISQQTGGPGGLQGAFQIEEMIANDRLDEVYQMMQKSLTQQFGGRIVTRGEAAQDQDAASQYMKQVQFLTSGPFGKVVQTSEAAARVLQAFQSGGGGIDITEMGRGATQEALTADQELQKKQNDVTVTMANDVKGILREMQIQNAMTTRGIQGALGMQEVLKKYQQKSSGFATGASGRFGTSTAKTPTEALLEDLKKSTDLVMGGEELKKQLPDGTLVDALSPDAGLMKTAAFRAKQGIFAGGLQRERPPEAPTVPVTQIGGETGESITLPGGTVRGSATDVNVNVTGTFVLKDPSGKEIGRTNAETQAINGQPLQD